MPPRAAVVLVSCLVSIPAVTAQGRPELRTAVARWVTQNQAQIIGSLVELLSIPNIASDHANIHRNAEHLLGMLRQRGFTAELLETDGNPLVYGELKVPDASRTLLFYSHYDGQPVDAKAWKQADPFTPMLRTARLDRGGAPVGDMASVRAYDPEWRLYARSASDDKSPIVALCAALDALKAAGLSPTANVRVILDGEEEASSPSLVSPCPCGTRPLAPSRCTAGQRGRHRACVARARCGRRRCARRRPTRCPRPRR